MKASTKKLAKKESGKHVNFVSPGFKPRLTLKRTLLTNTSCPASSRLLHPNMYIVVKSWHLFFEKVNVNGGANAPESWAHFGCYSLALGSPMKSWRHQVSGR